MCARALSLDYAAQGARRPRVLYYLPTGGCVKALASTQDGSVTDARQLGSNSRSRRFCGNVRNRCALREGSSTAHSPSVEAD